MAKRRPIRDKLLLGGLVVLVMVAVLSASSFLGVSSYRRLVRALSYRATELPRASDLSESVGLLRLAQAQAVSGSEAAAANFLEQLARTREALERYCDQPVEPEFEDLPIADRSLEEETAEQIEACLSTIDRIANEPPHEQGEAKGSEAGLQVRMASLEPHLERLAALSAELPTYLQNRLHDLSREVRSGYRTLIFTTFVSGTAAAALLAALGVLTYRWVFRPLRHLGQASRRVAAGDFNFRIHLDTQDEMAELAGALDDMTRRFREIRDDLDRQVQLRTREVIRSEQLASVGFLAAGVAHEINNPLASIAMCAESLESRLDAMAPSGDEAQVAKRYLELIQNEAFRCKGITEKLLDFSRLGEVRRQATAITALVRDVADMLRHVGRFAGRSIDIADGPDVLVMVNPQEIKQVVLNLLVNALDSIEQAGHVCVAVRKSGGEAVITFTDDGCGMTDEVLEHLFEPFFTRRKAGQGTGLGLSIVHRIITDHGGRIEAESDGEGKGSTFRVTLPLAEVGNAEPLPSGTSPFKQKEVDHRTQAA